MSSDWHILTKLRSEWQRGCYTQGTCLATLRKVEGRSTFLATRNATIAVAKWGVTREFFLATRNATFVALQVARKIASCNMALRPWTNGKCLATKHHQTLFGDQTFYRLDISVFGHQTMVAKHLPFGQALKRMSENSFPGSLFFTKRER